MSTIFESPLLPATPPETVITSLGPEPADLCSSKRKWGIYSPGELKQRCRQITAGGYLIEGLFPERTIGMVVGDSGIGKSPLLYQAALCVAAGIPFLGHAVQQGRVLYADFENGLADADELISRLARHLGLSESPDDLLLWNFNDSPPKYHSLGGIPGMIRDVRPRLAIIDSLAGCNPDAEEKNSAATRLLQEYRSVARECGTTVIFVHHLRKPSTGKWDDPTPRLELVDHPREWFHMTRGAGALINGSDIRLGIDVPTSAGSANGRREEVALLWRGFGRVRGEIPTTYLARVCDANGEPLGYNRLTGTALLFNQEQEAAFGKLPDSFRFKDAQTIYGKGGQATTDFLKKCANVGILEKLPSNQGYRKLRTAE